MKKEGICFVCGCTDADPCFIESGTCYWANKQATLCSDCAPLDDKQRAAMRLQGIEYLTNDLDRLAAEMADVLVRREVLQSNLKPGGEK